MFISLIPAVKFNTPQTSKTNKKISFANNNGDIVSFTRLARHKLAGADLAYANLSKAPLEKFNSVEDFRVWASKQLETVLDTEQYKKNNELDGEIISSLNAWKKYLTVENDIYKNNPALSLIIFRAVTSDLSSSRNAVPPILNPGVLADSVEQFHQRLNNDTNNVPNFKKIYEKNLRLAAIGSDYVNTGTEASRWIVIPSKKHDPKNFKKNVDRLKTLSYSSWCTKSYNAKPYLAAGDFHIYLDNGQPRAAIRFIGDEIAEIQGIKNNSQIPLNYFEEINDYIKNNAFKCKKEASYEIEYARKKKIKLDKIKPDLKDAIKNNDIKKIFNYFSIDISGTDEQGYTLSSFHQPNYDIRFEDLGIDENKLLKNVCKIDGDANFRHSQAQNLTKLQSIGGYADFSASQVQNLSNLQSIGGDAVFIYSQVQDLSNLQSIGGYADFSASQVQDLSKLQYVGSDVCFSGSQVRDLSNLQSIGKCADFSNSEVRDLSNLQFIGRDANFNDSQVRDLSNLQYVGGDIYIKNDKIIGLNKLKSICAERRRLTLQSKKTAL